MHEDRETLGERAAFPEFLEVDVHFVLTQRRVVFRKACDRVAVQVKHFHGAPPRYPLKTKVILPTRQNGVKVRTERETLYRWKWSRVLLWENERESGSFSG